MLPVRHLQQWIEHNILLELAAAPFSKEDAALVPEAGACVECPKRTGHNVLLFEGIATQHDSCSDPKCYAAKLDAHVKQTVAAKPKLVQISTAYGQPKDGSAAVPRNKYVEIRSEKPTSQKQRDWPEYKTCKFTTEAIVTEGSEKGETKRVCANPDCPIHHARKQKPATDATIKAEQEKRRREEAIAQVTGLRVLSAIGEAVPVRLMKRDLLFVVERLAAVLDERRLAIILRQHNLGKPNVPPTLRPSCLRPFFASPTKAHSDACWSKWPFCKRHTRPTIPAKPSAKPPTTIRWTWPQSRPRSSRSSLRKKRPRPRRRPRPNRHRSPRRKQRHNPYQPEAFRRSQQDRLRISLYCWPSARPF